MENPKKMTQKRSSALENLGIKMVDSMLSKMDRGQLTLVLPDKSLRQYGSHPEEQQADIAVHQYEFFKKCFLFGDIGFGEAYMDGDWTTSNLTNLIKWMILNLDHLEVASGSKTKSSSFNILGLVNRFQHLMNKNSKKQGRKNIEYHYDLSNDFFEMMLDPTMTYSSGIFPHAHASLQEAQIEKYARLAKELKINERDHVLEVGSGWGGNAIYLAQTYGCRVTSITLSKEQLKYAQEKVKRLGLDHLIEFKILDYRDLVKEKEIYDKIVSIEMIEAVGDEYMEEYFSTLHRVLSPAGLLGIQAITCPDSRYKEYKTSSDWIQKHIFPGGLLPSVARMQEAISKVTEFHLHHLEDIGLHYAKTLSCWRDQFHANLDKVKGLGMPETFIRKWDYYLSYCEAAFLMRNISTVQVIYTRPNNPNLRI